MQKTVITTKSLVNKFNETNLQLASISYTRMTIIAILVLGEFNNVKLKGKTHTQKQACELLSISKSYASQCVKVASFVVENKLEYILENNKAKFDLAKMYKATKGTKEEFINAFNLERPKTERQKVSAKSNKSVEKIGNSSSLDKNNMVHITLDGKTYRIPMDILKEYEV